MGMVIYAHKLNLEASFQVPNLIITTGTWETLKLTSTALSAVDIN